MFSERPNPLYHVLLFVSVGKLFVGACSIGARLTLACLCKLSLWAGSPFLPSVTPPEEAPLQRGSRVLVS